MSARIRDKENEPHFRAGNQVHLSPEYLPEYNSRWEFVFSGEIRLNLAAQSAFFAGVGATKPRQPPSASIDVRKAVLNKGINPWAASGFLSAMLHPSQGVLRYSL